MHDREKRDRVLGDVQLVSRWLGKDFRTVNESTSGTKG